MLTSKHTGEELGGHLGESLRQWRIILGLSQELAAERADISLPTLRRIERGDPGVKMRSFLALVSVLNLVDRFIEAAEPLETDLGRMRAHLLGRQRARRTN
ncbi:helix-turn-helix domain-containing protein [Arthrobacter zhaoguopingii]|uniref:helix-turn-helix domain-containing protein n=1 Tax=Arthrobacter zhaoguopingii TaxID=2681491 RepID=UPI00135B8AAD|nr:helix-turn-helix domain-containing protein [Arthrobacter zhaoguopingii]